MRHIYFIRHSKRDFTTRNEREVPLTEEGVNLARELKSFFINKDISTIYSSPYERAIQTIRPTAELLNLKIILKEDFRERVIGEWVDNFAEFSQSQ